MNNQQGESAAEKFSKHNWREYGFDMLFYSRYYLSSPWALILRRRARHLQHHLNQIEIQCQVNQHFRDRATAHRWSTAYQIGLGTISIGVLRQLPNGRDRNGTLWLHPSWDKPDLTDNTPANIVEALRAHAKDRGPKSEAYAAEGYFPGDPRRAPNLTSIPISPHIYGLAIDLRISWESFNGPWTADARELVARFALTRPIPEEPWHFTLPGRKRDQPKDLSG